MFKPFKGKFSFTAKQYQVVGHNNVKQFIICELIDNIITLVYEDFDPSGTTLFQYNLDYYNESGLKPVDTFTDELGYITKLLKNKKISSVKVLETKYSTHI